MAELAAQVRALFAFVNERPPGELAVRAFNPDPARDGWSASGSVVEVNVEDAPFLVDTVTAELHDFGCQVRLVLHPVMGVERAEDGTVQAITPARGAPRRESVMHFLTDRRLGTHRASGARGGPAQSLDRAPAAVRDFLPMVERVERMIESAEAAEPGMRRTRCTSRSSS